MSSQADEVRSASARFYLALSRMTNGDDSSIAAAWSQGQAVTTMHPVTGRQVGWDQVRESFHQFSLVATDGKLRLEDQIIQVAGDMAYELGVERGSLKVGGQVVNVDSRVTNIYRRESGDWKLVHHHSDHSPAMMAALDRLTITTSAAH